MVTFPATLESIAADLQAQGDKTRAIQPSHPVNTSEEARAAHRAKLEASADAYQRAASIIRYQIECES